MTAKFLLPSILLNLAVALAGVLAQESPPHSAISGLQVSGTSLLWNGQPVMLRGVAVGDPFLAREGRPLSDYATIANVWRANVVRISLHPSVWKATPHSQIIARLRSEAQSALDAGMFVILDWHVIGWPDGYFQKPDKEWDEDPRDLYDSNFALAKDFWNEVAAAFGGDGRVIFELWNEPVFQKDDYEPKTGQQWPKLKPYMAQLLEIIRAHGPNVALVTSNTWAYRLTGIRHDLLAGDNVAYAWHVYAGHDDDDEKLWAVALDDLQTVAPVIVSEWGFQPKTKEHFRGTAETFGKKFTRNFLDAKQLHSVAWCWHPDWTPGMLRHDWKTPTEMGAFVLNYLRAHNPPPNP